MAGEGEGAPGPIGARLGADQPVGTLLFVMFVPSADRQGQEIDHDDWVEQALATLGKHFRGATAYPRARGVWRDDDREGELVFEQPTIVTCYANPADADDAALAELRRFLHRLGGEANQGEVGIVVGDEYYGISKFDDWRWNAMSGSSRKRKTRKSAADRRRVSRIGGALGASRSFKVSVEPHGPFGVAALAREVRERLASTGGRPADTAPTVRRLVPIRRVVWMDLQRRAERLSAAGRSVSPGQLAAILMEKGLQRLDESEGGDEGRTG